MILKFDRRLENQVLNIRWSSFCFIAGSRFGRTRDVMTEVEIH